MVVFEEITSFSRPLIAWYVFRRKKIFFLRENKSCSDKKWFIEHKRKSLLYRLDIENRTHFFDGFSHDDAFDYIDYFFSIDSNNYVINAMRKLYCSPDTDLAFKKDLHQSLSRFYYLNNCLGLLAKKFPKRKIIFVPSNGIEIYRTKGCDIYDYKRFFNLAKTTNAKCLITPEVYFSTWAKMLSLIFVAKRFFVARLYLLSLLAYSLFGLIANIFKKKIDKIKSIYGIMVVSPSRQFGNRIQKIDFLVDDQNIHKKDVIFISNSKLSQNHKDYFNNNGLSFVDNVNGRISWGSFKTIVRYLFSLILTFNLSSDNLVLASKMIYFYMKWNSFLGYVKIDKFITHSDFGLQSIARNILFHKKGIKTYYYMDSANYGCFFNIADSEKLNYRHNFFGFLLYDYFIYWNEEASEHFKNSYCQIDYYANCGCLWSEHVNLIKRGLISSDFKQKLYNYGYNDQLKLISVFDTTFHDDSITPYADGIEFLKDILRLLQDREDLFVVLKEKKVRNYHRAITSRYKDILQVLTALENHPRCYCISRDKERWISPSEMIAVSELTISFPYTSTTFEAIAAGQKALWHDATGRLKDTRYAKVKGLVCHSYIELYNAVDRLLLNTSNDQYRVYLEDYIKNNIESYLDGKGIERFRDIVTSETNSNTN